MCQIMGLSHLEAGLAKGRLIQFHGAYICTGINFKFFWRQFITLWLEVFGFIYQKRFNYNEQCGTNHSFLTD